MKKVKSLMLRNKVMSILVLISIILIIMILFIMSQLVFTSSNPYGNRLDGIDKVEINKGDLDKMKNKMLEDTKVKEAKVYLEGKVINFIYETEETEEFSTIIKNMEDLLGTLSEEEKEYYDVQVFIEGNSDKLPIIGYKSNSTDSIIWTQS